MARQKTSDDPISRQPRRCDFIGDGGGPGGATSICNSGRRGREIPAHRRQPRDATRGEPGGLRRRPARRPGPGERPRTRERRRARRHRRLGDSGARANGDRRRHAGAQCVHRPARPRAQARRLTASPGAGRRFVIQIVERADARTSIARLSSPAATSAARSTACTISRRRSACRPGTGGPTCPCGTATTLYVLPGRTRDGEPAVKYRGIFINDEAPALAGWAQEKFGGFNHKFYEQVFELILRLQGQLPVAGDVGQRVQRRRPAEPAARRRIRHRDGHVAPRADDARARRSGSATARARGTTRRNDATLREFWTRGHRATWASHESIVTVGMRGDGDVPMTRGREHRAARAHRRATSGRSSPTVTEQARVARRRRSGRSTRKCRTTTTRACACPTTSRCSCATTTGATSGACRRATRPQRAGGFGHLLPLRLRRRAAQLQVDQHESDRARLGADAPRVRATARRASGS